MFLFTFSTRTVIFFLSLALTAALGGASFCMAGLAGFVLLIGRPLLLNSSLLPFWPKTWPAYKIPVEYAWYYIYTSAGVLLFAIPALLAILEHLYFFFRYKSEKELYPGN